MTRIIEHIIPVLLCGGEGKRLRPLSRASCPKPFIRFFKSKSLFEQSWARLVRDPIIVTRHDLLPLVEAQALGRYDVISEPMAKNTAPAIIKTCLETPYPDKFHIFMPTDHDIVDIHPLWDAINATVLGDDKIHLFGIHPDAPSNRYGYIGGSPLRFFEKPSLQKARDYIQQGFLWNSGIVLAKPKAILEAARAHVPEMLSHVETNRYDLIEPLSFDYAILEKNERIVSIPVSLKWRDVGTLRSYLNYRFGKNHE